MTRDDSFFFSAGLLGKLVPLSIAGINHNKGWSTNTTPKSFGFSPHEVNADSWTAMHGYSPKMVYPSDSNWSPNLLYRWRRQDSSVTAAAAACCEGGFASEHLGDRQ